jgi:hypothetical protein
MAVNVHAHNVTRCWIPVSWRTARQVGGGEDGSVRSVASRTGRYRFMASRSESRPPWKQQNPKQDSTALTPAQKAEARARARAAGRTYPNLVDNMAVARKRTSRKAEGGKDEG